MSASSKKLEHDFDDNTEILTIEGIKISYDYFRTLSVPTQDPHVWFRIISTENGVVQLECRRILQ